MTPAAASTEATGRASANYKWFVAAMLFSAAALNYGDRTAMTAVFPLLRRDLGMSDLLLGATGTVFLWSYAIVSPFAGFLGDRISRTRLLTISLGSWSLVMTLSGFAASAAQLLWLRVALGLAEAGYIPAATALIADHHGPATRAKAIGIHLAGFSFGMVGGGWLAGYLGDSLGWRPSFFILGACGLVLTGVCALFLRDAPAEASGADVVEKQSMGAAIRSLARIPTFLILTFELVCSGTVNWIFINWLPLFFKETFTLSLAMAGLYGTLWIQGGRVLGFLVGGGPSDAAARRHSHHRMLIMVITYVLAAPVLLTFSHSRNFVLIASAIFVYNLLVGFGYVNAQPLLCELLPVRLRSTAVGIMNMSACFAGGAGILAAGWLKSDYGLAHSFSSLSVVVFGIAGVLLAAYFTVLPRDLERARATGVS